jgi:lactate racemase
MNASVKPTGQPLLFPGVGSASYGLRHVEIPWGPSGILDLVLPSEESWQNAQIDVRRPDLEGKLADYREELERALDSPLGMPKLEDGIGPTSRVAIVVDDPSRWTPVADVLPIVLRRLHEAQVPVENVSITVGVGRHHSIDAVAMRNRLGHAIAARYRCESPPIDNLSAYTHLGWTPQGIPIRIFKPVAGADVRVLVGSVLPHLQAGFGGGYKLVLPGTSHRSTLGALHRQGLGRNSRPETLIGGDAAQNPMRQAVQNAAQLLGPCYSVSHLMGGPGEIFRVLVGHPIPVQDTLATEAKRRFQAQSSTPVDVVAVGNYPWPGDPMQSFKVLLHHRTACRPGGVLVGLFWTDAEEVDRSFPMGLLHGIASMGQFGARAIVKLLPVAEHATSIFGNPSAFMLHWARELVVDRSVLVYAPPLFDRLGPWLGPVQLFADQTQLWNAVELALHRSGRNVTQPLVRVFPYGGLSYVTAYTDSAK